MNNYQLYRTNVLLGGQMKWDIIVDADKTSTSSSDKNLKVSDFHLSPISKNMPFTYNKDTLLLNYNHQTNVKEYYKKHQTYFYKECLDKKFDNCNPIICHDDTDLNINTYSNIYDCGCRRAVNYKTYNKQFEYFCPVWIEKLTKNIIFSFEVITCDNNMTISTSDLELKLELKDLRNENIDSYHRKFAKYLKTYINDAKLQRGDDELMNIIFRTKFAALKGLNVRSGLFETKSYNNLAEYLTNHERPLIENDNLIIRSFERNNMICKQLFNFNICFNIEDIISENVANMIYGNNVKIKLTIKIDDKILEKRDFYTNYEYVELPENSALTYTKNALDYLQDYKYFEIIDKNKFYQPICHWTLLDNNEYIFNVYKGFDIITNYKILEPKNVFYVNNYEEYSKIVKKENSAHIYKNYYANNTKYYYNPIDANDNGFYLIGVVVPDEQTINTIKNKYNVEKIHKIIDSNKNDIGELYLITPDLNDNLCVLVCIDDDMLNSCNIYKLYNYMTKNKLVNSGSYVEKIYKTFNTAVDSSLVKYNKIIYFKNTVGPTGRVDEITYYVKNNNNKKVNRFDGKIKPFFTEKKPILYCKEKILESDLQNSVYTNPNYTRFKPVYPSIGYCGIKKLTEDWQYDKLPKENILGNTTEYVWFDDNKYILLKSKITGKKYSNQDNKNITLDDAIKEIISETYKIDLELNVELINYIKNLYKYTNNLDYASNETTTDYIYNITLELK